METQFRRVWLSDWRLRVIDAVLHIVACLLIPGVWYVRLCAFAPDAALPALWLSSMVLNRFLSESNPILRVHRFLHSLPGWFAFTFGCWVVIPDHTGWVFLICAPIQYGLHLAIDSFTHEEGWK